MTQINTTELALLNTLDQGILWAVVSLHRANTHPLNTWYSDNAAVRQQVAKNLLNWSISQNDKGVGKFSFSALMPILDHDPMTSQTDICQVVKSYSGFKLTDQEVDPPQSIKGFPMPPLPDYIETMEQLLFFLCRIAAAINHAIASANKAIDQKPEDSFTVPIDTSGPVPVVDVGVILNGEFRPSTAAEIIRQYSPPLDLHLELETILGFMLTGIGDHSASGVPPQEDIDEGEGYREKGIETLPVCQEQDPAILTFSDGDVLNLLNKTA